MLSTVPFSSIGDSTHLLLGILHAFEHPGILWLYITLFSLLTLFESNVQILDAQHGPCFKYWRLDTLLAWNVACI